jgi:SAM-dependent methyltransferase
MTIEIYTKENSDYLRNNPTWHTEDSPWKAKQILNILERNSINAKSIVEIGCGAGEILNQLHMVMPGDIIFSGYDISPDAIKLAKKREKDRLSFRQEDFLVTNGNFDLLLMIDILEHLDDYLGFLKLCKDKARNTIFHIPLDITVQGVLRNNLIHSRKSVGHLHYFTKETALATLIDCGFEIIDSFYTDSGEEFPANTLKSKLAVFPRKLFYKINKDFAVRLLGGYSLLVLTK